MSKEHAGVSTRTSRVIRAPREELYAAFLDPTALADWLPPAKMTGEIHELDARVGGGYRMSLFYASRSALSAVRRPTGDGGLPQPSPNDARSSGGLPPAVPPGCPSRNPPTTHRGGHAFPVRCVYEKGCGVRMKQPAIGEFEQCVMDTLRRSAC